jgi:hypothetical protein
MAIKIGEYRSKKFYKLGAKVIDVKVMLDRLSRVHGRNEKDSEHLETARRYAMKAAVHVLDDVVWELNTEHIERLQEDPEWQKVEAESIRQVIREFEERKDAEFHKLSEEAEESAQ